MSNELDELKARLAILEDALEMILNSIDLSILNSSDTIDLSVLNSRDRFKIKSILNLLILAKAEKLGYQPF